MTCSKQVVKLIYDSFISSTDSFPEKKTYQKWKTILRITISQDNFIEYFAAIHSCTTATKLREFQYKILHSTLITNEKLYQWGMIENNICTFCHNFTETILHLFLECDVSRGLWNDIAEYLARLCNFRIEMSDVDIILGIVGAEDSHKLLNLINIAIKYYIYTCRCNNRQPTAPSAIEKIKDLHHIEHSITVKKIILWTNIIANGSGWNLCCNCALMSLFLF